MTGMLGSLRRGRNLNPYVCWRCFASLSSSVATRGGQSPSNTTVRRKGNESWPKLITQRDDRKFLNTTKEPGTQSNPLDPLPLQLSSEERRTKILEQLRSWERENVNTHVPMVPSEHRPGAIENSVTRILTEEFTVHEDAGLEDDVSNFTAKDLLDIGSKRGFLLPGDLVELGGVGGRVELAIFVCEVNGVSQFYTMSGIWLDASLRAAQFYVPNFVEEHELEVLHQYIPGLNVPQTESERTGDVVEQVPRVIGKPLMEKMRHFWTQSDVVYQGAVSRLHSAHSLVANPDSFRYATLEELAELILPAHASATGKEKYSYHALYAVHRSLMRDDICFRPQLRGSTRTGGQYEVSSLSEVKDLTKFMESIRTYQETISNKRLGVKIGPSSLLQCVKACKELIDLSRESRQLTAHGTIGPLTKHAAVHQGSNQKLWREAQDAIRFAESWAALGTIGRHSPLNAIGSAFLRLTERYDGLPLDKTTAWTFLQEVRAIDPWTSRVPFELRVATIESKLQTKQHSIAHTEDSISSLRKDFGDGTVYCIDDATAHEIDDGVSIEHTAVSNEYWIHIHIADPASRLGAHENPSFASQAETIYLPEQVFFMIPPDFVQSNLSLGPGRPSLTFSARMNLSGDLLETKVCPHTIHDVKYLTPSAVKEILTGVKPRSMMTVHGIGPDITSHSSSVSQEVSTTGSNSGKGKDMLGSQQLSDKHKEDLRILQQIGEGRLEKRRAKGGVSMNYASGTQVSVNLQSTLGGNLLNLSGSASAPFQADPSIRLSKEDSTEIGDTRSTVDIVAPLMLIGAEIAAHWCHERGIPIPYRVSPRNSTDPTKFFQDVVLPNLDASGKAPDDIAMQYFRLLGTVIPSTTPGPHLGVGVEMMARCTSPLRRYGDLLLHWQVHAALKEEARLGHDIIGNTKEDFLPFSKAQVDRVLAHIGARERLIKEGNRNSAQHWICQFLIRAWRFNEAPLPPTFVFVAKTDARGEVVKGQLPYFSATATMSASDMINIEGVKVGDRFEVELSDVNVYTRTISVKPTRHLE